MIKEEKAFRERLKPYTDYICGNVLSVAERINMYFDDHEEEIRKRLLDIVRNTVMCHPEHYDWVSKHTDRRGYGGRLVENGQISLDQTLNSFLTEYTGGHNLMYRNIKEIVWDTYGDELSGEFDNVGRLALLAALKEILNEQFNASLADNMVEDIYIYCPDGDEVFDNCKAAEFFSAGDVVETYDIGDMLLSDIVLQQKTAETAENTDD